MARYVICDIVSMPEIVHMHTRSKHINGISQSLLGRSRDVGLKSRQRVKPRAKASADLTPISLDFTLFKHNQVNNWIDIVIFFCPLLF